MFLGFEDAQVAPVLAPVAPCHCCRWFRLSRVVAVRCCPRHDDWGQVDRPCFGYRNARRNHRVGPFCSQPTPRGGKEPRFLVAICRQPTPRGGKESICSSCGRSDSAMGRTATSIIKANYTKKATEDEIEAYYTLQALPNFIEGIAVIEDEFEGLSLDLVDRLWGV